MSRAIALLSLLVMFAAPVAAQTIYRPGFYRLATEAAFVGRVGIDAVTPARGADGQACGLVHEATVIETVAGAGVGEKVRFVAQVEPGAWPPGAEAFAMLFAHALPGGEGRARCWGESAPLFAAGSPASIVTFDRRAGEAFGGEYLPAGPDNVLAGLRFSALEIVLDGRAGHFASWELVRAYARQMFAARKALPLFPDKPADTGLLCP